MLSQGAAVIQESKAGKGGKGGKGGKAKKKEDSRIPFPWRFADKGDRAMRVERMLVDLIATSVPSKLVKDITFTVGGKEKSLKSVAITDKRYRNLTKTSKRAVSQVSVMFGLSPNKVAEAAGFEKGGGWEWLHLVAFSFGHQYVSSLSDSSLSLFRKTKQQQQIPENLVLGTAAANTAMLQVESAIKASLAGQPDLQLQLWAHASENSHEATVDGDTWFFKSCDEIRYHFRFFKRYHDADGIERELSTGAIIMTFDPFSHVRPLKTEYSQVHQEIVEFSRRLYELSNPTQGIRTGGMVGM